MEEQEVQNKTGSESGHYECFDITTSLPSLQFELGLTDSEMAVETERLRVRSHAITACQCAQAIHFTYSVNKARMLIALSKHKAKKMAKFTGEIASENPMMVGILGCGRLGSQLANLLLTYGRVRSSELLISTRRPEILESLTAKGVSCFYDNARLVKSVDLVFLCVLPGHIDIIADEIQSQIPESCLLYSFVGAYRPKRLKTLLKHRNVIAPEYSWNGDNDSGDWDYGLGVAMVFGIPDMMELTCPLKYPNRRPIVTTDPRFVDLSVYAFANMCTTCGYSRSTTIKLINLILFGISEQAQITAKPNEMFIESDLTKKNPSDTTFPQFDLCLALTIDTPVLAKINQNKTLDIGYRHEYINVFTSYQQKNLLLGLTKYTF